MSHQVPFIRVSHSADLAILKAALLVAVDKVIQQDGIPVVLWTTTDTPVLSINESLQQLMLTPPWNFATNYDPSKIIWIEVPLPDFEISTNMLRLFNSEMAVTSLDSGVGAVAIQFQAGLQDYKWNLANNWLNSISTTLAIVPGGAAGMRQTDLGYSVWFRSIKGE